MKEKDAGQEVVDEKHAAAAKSTPTHPPACFQSHVARIMSDADNRSEKEKMLAGELYCASDALLTAQRQRCQGLLQRLNSEPVANEQGRWLLVKEIFGQIPDESDVGPHIEPTFRCDYGYNISFGRNFYCNFDCCVLDCCAVSIGDDCFFGPRVQIYTAGHPVEPRIRGNARSGLEFAKPISIGNRCWLGGCAIVLPGVNIGDNVTVGAGSVVTKDVPSGVVVAGNPARIIRKLTSGGVPAAGVRDAGAAQAAGHKKPSVHGAASAAEKREVRREQAGLRQQAMRKRRIEHDGGRHVINQERRTRRKLAHGGAAGVTAAPDWAVDGGVESRSRSGRRGEKGLTSHGDKDLDCEDGSNP